MVANPSFPQEGGVTVGSVFNTNEWGAIDCLAAGTQTWMGNGGGRETETDRLTEKQRHTQTEGDLHQADESAP